MPDKKATAVRPVYDIECFTMIASVSLRKTLTSGLVFVILQTAPDLIAIQPFPSILLQSEMYRHTMMKKPKVSAPVCSLLPVDVIVKIAFSIPVAADLFAFLVALRPYNLQGPLEHLYQLGLKLDRSFYLWPCLLLPPSLEEWSTSYEAIAKYYSKVVIEYLGQATWLKKHLNPQTKIEWDVDEFPTSVSEIADEAWDLRITRVHHGFNYNPISSGKEILSRLQHLTSLTVYDKYTNAKPGEVLMGYFRICSPEPPPAHGIANLSGGSFNDSVESM
ncbi:hypothetical protein AC1031_006436 [Aphanomyces cochlioides]|nr:hypothetical protein AC1031_006436 [Aphanomyces cochlioides]